MGIEKVKKKKCRWRFSFFFEATEVHCTAEAVF